MSHEPNKTYKVAKGEVVHVVDAKGRLHEHTLKSDIYFWPGFDEDKTTARQTRDGEKHLDPGIGYMYPPRLSQVFYVSGPINWRGRHPRHEVTAQQAVDYGNVIFTTAHEKWPLMVVGAEKVKVIHSAEGLGVRLPLDVVAFQNCPEGVGE